MRKTDKKIDNQIRVALTDVCESALEDFTGFQWLTHLVDYSYFPKSLRVICVFDTNDHLARFMADDKHCVMNKFIHNKLLKVGINMSDVARQVSYDTEENCENQDGGKWADRFDKVSLSR